MRLARGLAAGFLLLAAIDAASAETVLRRASAVEPGSLDPAKITGIAEGTIVSDLFLGLTQLDPDHVHAVPGAASSWDVSPDGKIWRFHLRPGEAWSDGSPVTAADFVYSMQREVDPATAAPGAALLREVENAVEVMAGHKPPSALGVSAPDPLTVEIRLSVQRPILPFILAFERPVPRAAIERWGAEWTRPGHMVSNGPYALESWTPQADIVLRRNPHFFDAASVEIDTVHYVLATDPAAAFKRFEAGELDIAEAPAAELPRIRTTLADRLHSGPSLQSTYLVFNMVRGIFLDHPQLREALSLTVDRETLATRVDQRGQIPAYGFIPPLVPGYQVQPAGFATLSPAERLDRAKSLYAEAGYGPDKPLVVTASFATDDATRRVLLALAAMWQRALGVKLQLQNEEWQVNEARLRERNFEIEVRRTDSPFADAESFLFDFRSDAGLDNPCGYADPRFDKFYYDAAVEQDPAQRSQLLAGAERTLVDDAPIAPLFFGTSQTLVAAKVSGWRNGVAYPQTRYLSVTP
jgi:oligopeptide transport system substrate-binding protein